MCSEGKLNLASSTMVCIKPSQSDELLHCHLSYLMHPQKSYDAINMDITHFIHIIHMFQSAKSQKISRNTNVHNSDVLNTVFKLECRVLIIQSTSMKSDIQTLKKVTA